MSDLTNKLEPIVKRTLGYSESENKREFLKGANVGIMKVEEIYENEIKSLKTQLESWKRSYEMVHNDMKTVTTIFNNYSE